MRTATIKFDESSKSVNASVKIEGDGEVDIEGNNKALIEAQRLFEEAQKYSVAKTMRKL